MRAAAQGLRAAHRRPDAEPSRNVVRRRDDAAAVGLAADDERLRPQLGLLQLLDGGVERVEVEMGQDRHCHQPTRGPRWARDRRPAPAAAGDRRAGAAGGLVRPCLGDCSRRHAAADRARPRPRRRGGAAAPALVLPAGADRRRRSRQRHGGRRTEPARDADGRSRLRPAARGDAARARRPASTARLRAGSPRSCVQYGGTTGIYVEDLQTGRGAAWNAKARFPAASTLKLAIAVTVLRNLDGKPAEGSDVARLLAKMIVFSDNEAANELEVWLAGSTSAGSAPRERDDALARPDRLRDVRRLRDAQALGRGADPDPGREPAGLRRRQVHDRVGPRPAGARRLSRRRREGTAAAARRQRLRGPLPALAALTGLRPRQARPLHRPGRPS